MLAAAFSPFLSAFNASGSQATLLAAPTAVNSSSSAQTMSLPRAPQGLLVSNEPAEAQIAGDSLMPVLASAADDDHKDADISQISIHIYHEGEKLAEIAEMYDVTVETIRNYNDLKPGQVIKPGTALLILPVSGARYTIKSGDTLESIAKRFKADADEIGRFNNIASNELIAGKTIIIPDEDGVLHDDTAPKKSPVKSSSLPSIAGYYISPAAGKVTQDLHGHNGIDIGNTVGTTIKAAAAGKVVIARSSGWNGGYGLMVVIAHPNGTKTLYAHLSKVIVTEGQQVAQGEKIGEMGNTGKSTGPHLHYEVHGARNNMRR
jgi:LysM repeat protein